MTSFYSEFPAFHVPLPIWCVTLNLLKGVLNLFNIFAISFIALAVTVPQHWNPFQQNALVGNVITRWAVRRERANKLFNNVEMSWIHFSYSLHGVFLLNYWPSHITWCKYFLVWLCIKVLPIYICGGFLSVGDLMEVGWDTFLYCVVYQSGSLSIMCSRKEVFHIGN